MIDLGNLEALCRGLPPQTASVLAHRAAVALERRHAPGVRLRVSGDLQVEHELRWVKRAPEVARNEDLKEATSDGATGIALAVADRDRNWRVVRRLQSSMSEGADWWMVNELGTQFALEVKGTDDGPLPLAAAIEQARESFLVSRGAVPAACVVRFREPEAIFQTDESR